MGKLGNNALMSGVTGKVGNVVFRRGPGGIQTVSKKPLRRKKNSPKQTERIDLFTEASGYADKICEHPELKQLYAKKITARLRSAYHVALTDYLNPPKVVYIKTDKYTGTIGDMILIKATDDFQVTSVMVEITTIAGKVIEKGPASPYPRRPKLWRYYATAENAKPKECVVKVVAADRPGNKATMEVNVEDSKSSMRQLIQKK